MLQQYLRAAMGTAMAGLSIGNGIASARQYNANAADLTQQAREGLFGAAVQSGAIADRGDQIEGAQTAYYASGNIDPSFGSPLVMLAENADRVQRDIAITQSNALTRSAALYGKASDQAARAHQSRIAGAFGAAAALLSVGAKWPGLGTSGADSAGKAASATPDFTGIPNTENWIY